MRRQRESSYPPPENAGHTTHPESRMAAARKANNMAKDGLEIRLLSE
jgi:hypothetical protein